jgi:hypothetical protein
VKWHYFLFKYFFVYLFRGAPYRLMFVLKDFFKELQNPLVSNVVTPISYSRETLLKGKAQYS